MSERKETTTTSLMDILNSDARELIIQAIEDDVYDSMRLILARGPILPGRKPTIRERLRWWFDGRRRALGLWIAGLDEEDLYP